MSTLPYPPDPDFAKTDPAPVEVIHMPLADRSLRLLNLIIDSLVLAVLEIIFLLALEAATGNEDYAPMTFFFDQERPYWQSLLFGLPFTVFYYTPMEVLLGRSLGKMLTKTRVVRAEDGAPISWGQGLIRSLVRLFGLEALVYIFTVRGPHDYFSKTLVVDERPSANLE